MLNIHFTFLIISNYISYIHKEVVDAVFPFILTSLQHINLCWMLLAHCLSIFTTHRLVLDAVFPFILAILQHINECWMLFSHCFSIFTTQSISVGC